MEQLPQSDSSSLVRVAGGDDAAWSRVKAVVATENGDGFRAYVEVIDAAEWHSASFDRLRAAVPQHADGASVLFLESQQTDVAARA